MKVCKICGVNKCTNKGRGKLSSLCSSCKTKPWARYRKKSCEFCGFIPVHQCQLDVDHKDGNNKNNSEENLQTLCANCHRLKTVLHNDHLSKKDLNVLISEAISKQLHLFGGF